MNTKEAAIDHTNWMTRDEILSWAQQYFDGQWINAGALETEAGKFADVVAYHAYRAGYTAASAEREWVPVEEWLPTLGQMVWVTRRTDGEVVKRVFVSPYSEDDFKQMFTAWMPAESEPQPYITKGEPK